MTLRHGGRGYIALATVSLGALRAIGIQDVVMPRAPRAIEGWALRLRAIAEASRAGAGVVLGLWNADAPLSQWMTGLPFVEVPERFLPHASPIFIVAAPGTATAPDEFGRAYLALADLDYF